MAARLKICGITSFEDAQAAANAGVNWLGFNFFPESPRYILPENAGNIIKRLPKNVETVAILVRPKKNDIIEIIDKSNVDILQIYEPQDFRELSIFNRPTIICYRINHQSNNIDYPMLNADMILFDSYSKKVYGGSGEQFNWNLIPKDIPKEKLILAGGITPKNIYRALINVNPAVIDVASGAEISPGKKDINKIKQMVKEIKRYNENYGKEN